MPVTRTNINEFTFIKKDGRPGNVTCTGHEIIQPKMTPIYATLGDSYEKVRTDLKIHHKQYTGPLTEEQRELFFDLFEAQLVYYKKGEYREKITILDIDFTEEHPLSEPIGMMFEWIVADENLRDVEQ